MKQPFNFILPPAANPVEIGRRVVFKSMGVAGQNLVKVANLARKIKLCEAQYAKGVIFKNLSLGIFLSTLDS